MKYTVQQAAGIVGKTRQTIYRHIETKPISVDKNDEGETMIDAAELIRVYGDKCDFDYNETVKDSPKSDNMLQHETGVNIDDIKELAELRVKTELLDAQMRRERELYEERIRSLEASLEKSQDSHKSALKLLEDQRGDGAGEWQKQFKAIEARLANREKKEKELEEEREKARRQNSILRKQLKQEQEKSIWKKLFG